MTPHDIPHDIPRGSGGEEQPPTPRIDTSVPHSARIWNYWLGGKDNYAVDRAAGDKIKRIFPDIQIMAQDGRAFLGRAVRCLAAEHGIRQFLDLGTGLPTDDNTHQIAQQVNPTARVVYVDNDPVVLVHARALLTSSPPGVCQYIDADLTDPRRVLDQAERTLDLEEPVAVILASVLPHIPDDGDAAWTVWQYMDAVAPGSALVISHDAPEPSLVEAAREFVARGGPVVKPRTYEQVAGLIPDGVHVVEPGVTATWAWRPNAQTPQRNTTLQYGLVAVKAGEDR
ncbi:SAM-dependent methyltransferase [Thermomonospora cellulosilytica]|uniref:S-adenosyl methyltransferase n=1 Tax=Thermomonospora cellulosilytica TaxID=1411118 RepID=A0A7W3N1M8_9ACTN|nr:SAM-dependent methyltransferase [Thermomonospora cellulosilytica]MBA9005920.1 hypothetical protein [Thermomonospora cellulosilytica]